MDFSRYVNFMEDNQAGVSRLITSFCIVRYGSESGNRQSKWADDGRTDDEPW